MLTRFSKRFFTEQQLLQLKRRAAEIYPKRVLAIDLTAYGNDQLTIRRAGTETGNQYTPGFELKDHQTIDAGANVVFAQECTQNAGVVNMSVPLTQRDVQFSLRAVSGEYETFTCRLDPDTAQTQNGIKKNENVRFGDQWPSNLEARKLVIGLSPVY